MLGLPPEAEENEVRFFCRRCWGLAPRSFTAVPDRIGGTCGRGHPQTSDNPPVRAAYLKIKKWKWFEVRKPPSIPVPPGGYEYCVSFSHKNRCTTGAKCTFAHSEPERLHWQKLAALKRASRAGRGGGGDDYDTDGLDASISSQPFTEDELDGSARSQGSAASSSYLYGNGVGGGTRSRSASVGSLSGFMGAAPPPPPSSSSSQRGVTAVGGGIIMGGLGAPATVASSGKQPSQVVRRAESLPQYYGADLGSISTAAVRPPSSSASSSSSSSPYMVGSSSSLGGGLSRTGSWARLGTPAQAGLRQHMMMMRAEGDDATTTTEDSSSSSPANIHIMGGDGPLDIIPDLSLDQYKQQQVSASPLPNHHLFMPLGAFSSPMPTTSSSSSSSSAPSSINSTPILRPTPISPRQQRSSPGGATSSSSSNMMAMMMMGGGLGGGLGTGPAAPPPPSLLSSASSFNALGLALTAGGFLSSSNHNNSSYHHPQQQQQQPSPFLPSSSSSSSSLAAPGPLSSSSSVVGSRSSNPSSSSISMMGSSSSGGGGGVVDDKLLLFMPGMGAFKVRVQVRFTRQRLDLDDIDASSETTGEALRDRILTLSGCRDVASSGGDPSSRLLVLSCLVNFNMARRLIQDSDRLGDFIGLLHTPTTTTTTSTGGNGGADDDDPVLRVEAQLLPQPPSRPLTALAALPRLDEQLEALASMAQHEYWGPRDAANCPIYLREIFARGFGRAEEKGLLRHFSQEAFMFNTGLRTPASAERIFAVFERANNATTSQVAQEWVLCGFWPESEASKVLRPLPDAPTFHDHHHHSNTNPHGGDAASGSNSIVLPDISGFSLDYDGVQRGGDAAVLGHHHHHQQQHWQEGGKAEEGQFVATREIRVDPALLLRDDASVRLLQQTLGAAGVPHRFWETMIAGAVAEGIQRRQQQHSSSSSSSSSFSRKRLVAVPACPCGSDNLIHHHQRTAGASRARAVTPGLIADDDNGMSGGTSSTSSNNQAAAAPQFLVPLRLSREDPPLLLVVELVVPFSGEPYYAGRGLVSRDEGYIRARLVQQHHPHPQYATTINAEWVAELFPSPTPPYPPTTSTTPTAAGTSSGSPPIGSNRKGAGGGGGGLMMMAPSPIGTSSSSPYPLMIVPPPLLAQQQQHVILGGGTPSPFGEGSYLSTATTPTSSSSSSSFYHHQQQQQMMSSSSSSKTYVTPMMSVGTGPSTSSSNSSTAATAAAPGGGFVMMMMNGGSPRLAVPQPTTTTTAATL